jgi:hypothetical protein
LAIPKAIFKKKARGKKPEFYICGLFPFAAIITLFDTELNGDKSASVSCRTVWWLWLATTWMFTMASSNSEEVLILAKSVSLCFFQPKIYKL